jgi:regulator of nucleoside diphosphate kinase
MGSPRACFQALDLFGQPDRQELSPDRPLHPDPKVASLSPVLGDLGCAIESSAMTTSPAPQFTERDHAILFGLARQGGLHTAAYYELLHEKLRRAVIIPLERVEPDLATFGSLVRYRVDGGRPLEHKLLLVPRYGQEQHALSVKSLRGLALLGMREGHIFTGGSSGEQQEVMEIEMILFQPEADGEGLRFNGGPEAESALLAKTPE